MAAPEHEEAGSHSRPYPQARSEGAECRVTDDEVSRPDNADHGLRAVTPTNGGGFIALCNCGWQSLVEPWAKSGDPEPVAAASLDGEPMTLFPASVVKPVVSSNREEAKRAAAQSHRKHERKERRPTP